MDAPIHFNRGGLTTEQVALTSCIGPAAVIDFSQRALRDPNVTLSVNDIRKYEAIGSKVAQLVGPEPAPS